MKNKLFLIIIILFFTFCFFIFYKGLNNSNIYKPQIKNKKDIPVFIAKDFFSGNEFISKQIFDDDIFYILNIWASWCLPCQKEHSILMELSSNKSIKLIGLNYKDNPSNAKKFILQFGNPYSQIFIDKKGILAIEFGAYGIPETYIISKDKKIIKKFTGPLTQKSLKEIKLLLK
jgi:cytochrome c biogenesis protein CcmG, thiol:disulfide interchange protein DsbE